MQQLRTKFQFRHFPRISFRHKGSQKISFSTNLSVKFTTDFINSICQKATLAVHQTISRVQKISWLQAAPLVVTKPNQSQLDGAETKQWPLARHGTKYRGRRVSRTRSETLRSFFSQFRECAGRVFGIPAFGRKCHARVNQSSGRAHAP